MFRHADVVVCLCLMCILMAVLNAVFCMTCSLLMMVEDARGDHMEEAYSRHNTTNTPRRNKETTYNNIDTNPNTIDVAKIKTNMKHISHAAKADF